MTSTSSHDRGPDDVPELLLEQYRLGELPRASADALAKRIAQSPALRVRLDALERSDAEIRASGLPADVARRAVVSATSRPGLGRWSGAALAATAAMVLAVSGAWLFSSAPRRETANTSVTDGGGDRVKGAGATLTIFRRTGAGSEPLADGDLARAGDLLRIGYQASRSGYGAIVSIDGRGGVTQHFPASGQTAAALRVGELVLLDEAFELDDAPRWERFHLFSSQTPFDVAPLVQSLHAAGTGDVASSLEQSTLSLLKDATP